jgi:hypothetical protein
VALKREDPACSTGAFGHNFGGPDPDWCLKPSGQN